MAYDKGLGERIRERVSDRAGVSEKEMFGGVAFLQEGRMFVGIVKEDLMVRVGPERHLEALRQPNTRPMDFAGRPMAGYIYVSPQGHADDDVLDRWIDWSYAFVRTLPAKSKKPKKASLKKNTKSKTRPRK